VYEQIPDLMLVNKTTRSRCSRIWL